MPYTKIDSLMRTGVGERIFPGAVLLIGRGETILFHQAYGYAALVPEKQLLHRETLFDLASLTKPLATTLGIMTLVQTNRLSLDHSPADWGDRSEISGGPEMTIRHLLAHSAGYEAYHPYYLKLDQESGDKKALLRKWVQNEALKYRPGEQTIYSDLGFIALEAIIESVTGEDVHTWIRRVIYSPLGMVSLGFRSLNPSGVSKPENYAATEDCPWRHKVLRGEVHDENTFVVGGVSGQAGLFGTALDIFKLVRVLKRAYDRPEVSGLFSGELVRIFWERQSRPSGTTRALGFDTPSETASSAGKYFSVKSVGHLGFTGTSFWLDLEKDLIVILLTNRVHPSRANETIRTFRPLLHDQVFEEVFDS